MRALVVLALLGLCAPALCLDRWFVQASYTGACPAGIAVMIASCDIDLDLPDRTQATNVKAQLTGCVPVPYSFDPPVFNF